MHHRFPGNGELQQCFGGHTRHPTTGRSNLTAGDDFDRNVDNNGTPTDPTGPIGDHTSNNTSGNYIYVDASGATASIRKVAVLQSNSFDLTSLTNPYLTF